MLIRCLGCHLDFESDRKRKYCCKKCRVRATADKHNQEISGMDMKDDFKRATCKNCSTEFLTSRKETYCGSCSVMLKGLKEALTERECLFCKCSFKARGKKVYCSKRCTTRFHNQKVKEALKVKQLSSSKAGKKLGKRERGISLQWLNGY